MDLERVDETLNRTLDDHRLSRGERRALAEVLDDLDPDRRALGELRTRAFRAARGALGGPDANDVLGWLEEVVKLLQSRAREGRKSASSEVLFSPGDACVHRLSALIEGARAKIDVCVFTITDDRISRPLIAAHRRGVEVRVLTDDEKQDDRGSDVDAMRKAGLPVATDHSEHQMHHKFAIFDEALLVTGSYNWTRSAARFNQENIVITDDGKLLRAFSEEFERLWRRFTN